MIRKYLTYGFLSFLISCSCHISFSQYPAVLRGIVTNAETGDPMAYVNIGFRNRPQGTITNQQGRFIFRLPPGSLHDTLMFSCLGFRTTLIAIEDIETDSLKIVLQPIFYDIREVTKQSFGALNILEEALKRIPLNYPVFETGMTAFYREAIRENDKTIQVIEAVLGINKASYTDYKGHDRMMILKGRERNHPDYTRIWHYIDFVNGPYEAIESDVCKYPDQFVTLPRTKYNFLNRRYFHSYDYQLVHPAENEPMDYYQISVKPKSGQKKAVLEANIFIDRQSFAITRLDYKINPYYIKITSVIDYFTQSELQKVDIYTQTELFNCSVNYQKFKDKWYLRDVTILYKIILLWLNDLYLAEIQNSIQLVVTDFDENLKYPINFRNPVRRKVPLDEQIGVPDEEFWGNYNYLLKEE